MAFHILASLALFGTAALAKTDLAGCTYIDGVFTPDHGPAWATRTWYVPDTGEICAFLDCGGGRAPPKTTVPGCGSYEGTETYSPLFLDLASITGDGEVVQTSTDEVAEATTTTTTEAEASSTSESGEDVALQTTLPSSLATETSSETSSTEAESSAETSAQTSPATTSAPESTHSDHTTAQTSTSDIITTTPVLNGGDGEGAAAAPGVALFGSTLAAGMAVWFAMF